MAEEIIILFRKNEAVIVFESGDAELWRYPEEFGNPDLSALEFSPYLSADHYRAAMMQAGWSHESDRDYAFPAIIRLLAMNVFESEAQKIEQPPSSYDDIPF